jgi:hypothetical protein
MQPVVVETEAELRALIRDRIAELGTTYGEVDRYAGLADFAVAKLLAPSKIRGFGNKSLPLLLQALALGIARVEFIEDRAKAAKVRKRLAPSRRKLAPRPASRECIATDCKQDDLFRNNS